jgi:hypothetical protein
MIIATAQKYLIQKFPEKGIGVIYLWTPLLAKRDDMKPYDGEVPKSMRVDLVDAQLEAGRPIAAVDTSLSPVPLSAVPRAAAAAAKAVDAVNAGTGAGADIVAGSGSDTGVGKDPEAQTGGEKLGDGQDMTPALTPEQKHAKLVEIIGMWKPEDPENFTAAGLPRLDSLIAALGADVESRERDAAWEAFCAHSATASGQAE